MARIEVTDEMVDRAYAATGWVGNCSSRQLIRDVIDAALNPPAEPEIEVTDAMRAAGRGWIQSYGPDAAKWLEGFAFDGIYRAMYAARPSEPRVIVLPRYDSSRLHRRNGDVPHRDMMYPHRRKDDL